LGGGAVGGDAHARTGGGKVRVAGQVMIVKHHHLNVVAVGRDELAAPVVEAHPMLRAAALGAKVEQFWVEGKIAAIERDRGAFGLLGTMHFSAGGTGRAVNAIVQAPAEAVEKSLHV